jgi:hypothetical protein
MIKATDLRLGNWVLNPSTKKPVQITSMDISDIENNYKEREPIPLTEELFNKINVPDIESDFGGSGSFNYSDNGKLYLNDCDGGKIGKPIEFVHQLQNVFYFLQGEELPITL